MSALSAAAVQTQVPYLYRDAGNWKAAGVITLQGVLSDEDKATVKDNLFDYEKFIPFDLQMGIPELQSQLETFPSEDDHVFHELELDEAIVLTGADCLKGPLPLAEDFVAAMKRIGSNGWNVVAAVDRLGV